MRDGDGDEGSAGILGLKVSIAVAPESGNISGKSGKILEESGNVFGENSGKKEKIGEYLRREEKKNSLLLK